MGLGIGRRATAVAALAAFLAEQQATPIEEGRPSSRETTTLLEPLSARELEVLHLIAGGASNEEIAARLFIAVSTVKRHASNIFGKLNVSNRTQAVARARETGLL